MEDADLVKRVFEAKGLEVDDETVAALTPVHAGLVSGARRLAALDLGEREPSMTFRHLPGRKDGGR